MAARDAALSARSARLLAAAVAVEADPVMADSQTERDEMLIALREFALDKWGTTNPILVPDSEKPLQQAYYAACPRDPDVLRAFTPTPEDSDQPRLREALVSLVRVVRAETVDRDYAFPNARRLEDAMDEALASDPSLASYLNEHPARMVSGAEDGLSEGAAPPGDKRVTQGAHLQGPNSPLAESVPPPEDSVTGGVERLVDELDELFGILNVPGESDSHVRHKVKRRIRRLAESLRESQGVTDRGCPTCGTVHPPGPCPDSA